MKTVIDAKEWLDELAKLSRKSDAGLTTAEWAEKLGITHEAAQRRLREAFRLGWLIHGKRTEAAMNGRMCNRDVYRIVRPKRA